MNTLTQKSTLPRNHVAEAIRHMANEERGLANDLRNALRLFADKLDAAPRATLKPRGKAGVVISMTRAIGETIDRSRSVQIALQQVGYEGTINKLLLEKIKQYRDVYQDGSGARVAERLQIPYGATANRLRSLIRLAQDKPERPDDLLMYPLDIVAEVLFKLGSLDEEKSKHRGEFCSVCFRHVDGDGTTKTCSLHRHDKRDGDRKAYINALRRRDRYRELLKQPRPMHELERFLLDAPFGSIPRANTDEWREWAGQFDLHLKTSLPYAYLEISKYKTPSRCHSFEELVLEILKTLGDGSPPSDFLDAIDAETGKSGPQPRELLGLLSRADLWYRVDREFEVAVIRRCKIDKNRLMALNQQGLTTKAIAHTLGVTQQAVSVALQRMSIPAAHKKRRSRKP